MHDPTAAAAPVATGVLAAFVLVLTVAAGPAGALLAIPLRLLGTTLLVDANPDARWRPVMGPPAKTSRLLEEGERGERRARKRPVLPEPDPLPHP